MNKPIERQDIKTAIDYCDQYNLGEEGYVTATLMRCGNEIAQLRTTVAEQQQRIAELEKQLVAATDNPDDPAYWLHSSKQLLEKS